MINVLCALPQKFRMSTRRLHPLRENQTSTPVRSSSRQRGQGVDLAMYSPFRIETPGRSTGKVARRSNIRTVWVPHGDSVCIFVCVHICVYVCTHVCVCLWILCVCVCVWKFFHSLIEAGCVFTHMHSYTCTDRWHTHTHLHTLAHRVSLR